MQKTPWPLWEQRHPCLQSACCASLAKSGHHPLSSLQLPGKMTVVNNQQTHIIALRQPLEDHTSLSFDGALRFTPTAAANVGE